MILGEKKKIFGIGNNKCVDLFVIVRTSQSIELKIKTFFYGRLIKIELLTKKYFNHSLIVRVKQIFKNYDYLIIVN